MWLEKTKMHSTGTQCACQKCLFPATKAAHQSPATSFQPHKDTGHWPSLALETWPELNSVRHLGVQNEQSPHSSLTEASLPDGHQVSRRAAQSQPYTQPQVQQPQPASTNPTDLWNLTLAPEMGVAGRGHTRHGKGIASWHPHRSDPPTQPLQQTRENLSEIYDYNSVIAKHQSLLCLYVKFCKLSTSSNTKLNFSRTTRYWIKIWLVVDLIR